MFKMKTALFFILLTIFSVSAAYSRKSVEEKVLSHQSAVETSPLPSLKPSTASVINEKTKEPKSAGKLEDFIYPGSEVILSSSSHLSLKSMDKAEAIVNWYKQKLAGEFSSKAFATSNTNGNIESKMSASNDSQKIDISIINNGSELYTHIEVTTGS